MFSMKCLAVLPLATTCFLAMSPIAKASEWYLAATNNSDDKFFLDRSSIVKTGGKAKTNLFAVFQKADKGVIGFTGEIEFDCAAKKLRYLKYADLGEDGSTKQFGADKDWTPIKPGSVNDVVLKEVCSGR
jgi:hypothetical protein